MRLVVMPSHRDGDGHYRCLFPASELKRQHGWEIVQPPAALAVHDAKRSTLMYGVWEKLPDGRARVVDDVWTWLLDTPFDVLLMQQRTEPDWPGMIGRLRSQGKRVLVDSDDAWWGLPSWNPGSRKPAADVDAMKAQIAAADGLSVATPALADLYRPYQPNVRVIRNRLDWSMWADTVPVYERPTRKLRVGWMGDSSYRMADLALLRPVLGPWLKRHPDVEFVAAGDPRTHDVLQIPKAQRVSVAETPFWRLDLADITATFDIGLVPLDLSSPAARRMNECKSHLKGLEYNASGIPFIASPSESYRWWMQGRPKGFFAETPADWRQALDTLAENENLVRDTMGRCGRIEAEQHTVQRRVGEWGDWLAAGNREAAGHVPVPELPRDLQPEEALR